MYSYQVLESINNMLKNLAAKLLYLPKLSKVIIIRPVSLNCFGLRVGMCVVCVRVYLCVHLQGH